MWISVLEDEAVLNNLITKYLQKEWATPSAATCGGGCCAGLDKPTDLWVIDIMLPDIDGFTVFREVQRKNPNSYVIFISARNQDIDRLAGLELGGDDYISKPFLVRELVIKVQRLLKGDGLKQRRSRWGRTRSIWKSTWFTAAARVSASR